MNFPEQLDWGSKCSYFFPSTSFLFVLQELLESEHDPTAKSLFRIAETAESAEFIGKTSAHSAVLMGVLIPH